MKPSFALNLSYDGIRLLHRGRGGWHEVGEVALDDPELADRLAWLRKSAAALATGGVTTKLVIPNSEILYLTLEDLADARGVEEHTVRAALEGRTPYAVDDLAFDYVAIGADVQVAVVARETLEEAEAFAAEHRFNPLSFVAVPEPGAFDGEPNFGMTRTAADLLDPDDPLERDAAPVIVTDRPVESGKDAPVVSVEDAAVAAALEAAREAQARAEAKEAAAAPEPPVEPPVDSPVDVSADAPVAPPVVPKRPTQAKPSESEAAPEVAEDTPAVSFRGLRRAQENAAAPDPEGVASRLEQRNARIGFGRDDAPPPPVATEPAADQDSEMRDASEAPGDPTPTPTFVPPAEAPAAEPRSVEVEVPVAKTSPALAAARVREVAPVRVTEIAPPPPDPRSVEAPAGLGGALAGKPIGLILTGALLALLLLAALATFLLRPSAEVTAPEAVPEVIETAVAPAETAPDEPALEEALDEESADVALLDLTEETAGPGTDPEAPRPMSLLEAEAAYAATGIWQRAPRPLETAPALPSDRLEDLYVAQLDSEIGVGDAVALPSYVSERDLRPITPRPPVAPGLTFTLDENGFVTATPEGALTQEGVRVRLGAPALRPPERPAFEVPESAEAAEAEEIVLVRPRARPGNAGEILERLEFGGYTRAELARLKPRARPESEQAIAAAAALAARADGDVESDVDASDLAVAAAPPPRARPSNIAEIVAAATPREAPRATAVAAVAPSTPTIPTRASVARQATIENAISLRRVNLIGVYGAPSDRRALVRLANGRYVKVEVGDRVDGGRVAAIGTTSLQYVKGGRNITLALPEG